MSKFFFFFPLSPGPDPATVGLKIQNHSLPSRFRSGGSVLTSRSDRIIGAPTAGGEGPLLGGVGIVKADDDDGCPSPIPELVGELIHKFMQKCYE